MEGVRLEKADLIRKFKIDQRFAVRIGALLAKQVQLTAPLIASAAETRALERFLRSAEFLEKADSLSTRSLARMVEKAGVETDSALVVQQEGGWRTIGLEEELLAEEGWKRAAEREAAVPVRAGTGLAPRLRYGIFEEDEEVAKVKLSAMTSSDAGDRAAAVRQLIYSPLSPQQRAAIFFDILVDPISRGRAEAIAGLEALGFSHDAGDALRDLFQGNEETRAIAIERVTALLKQLDEAQSIVVIGALLQVMRESDSTGLQQKILEALGHVAPLVAANPGYLAEVVKFCSKAVQRSRSIMAPSAKRILAGLAEADHDRVVDLLWEELGSVSNTSVRMFLMTGIAQFGPGEKRAGELATLMAKELTSTGASESERLLLAHGATSLGEAAVGPLLEVLETAAPATAAFVVPFLDNIAVDGGVSKTAKNNIAEHFLESLKVKERRVRMAVLLARLCFDGSLASKLRQALAAEFLENAEDFTFPDMCNQIDSSLEVMGKDAIDPIFEHVKRHAYEESADRFVRVLGRIVMAMGEAKRPLPARVKEIIRFCVARLQDDKVAFGGYVAALGMICSVTAGSPDFCEKLTAAMVGSMWRVPYTADFFEALGRLAASGQLPAGRRSGLAQFFLRVIRHKKPEAVAKERRTEDGLVYEFGRESDVETVLVPASVEALGRICLSPSVSEETKREIIEALMSAWEEASGWKVIWGPFSSETLAKTLGKIASSENVPMDVKLKIGRTIKPQIPERLSVVRAIGDICSQNVASSQLNELAIGAIDAIIEGWLGPESEAEERSIALKVLADIAARDKLNPRQKKVREARGRVIELLFEGLRSNIDGCLDALQKLRNCSGLTKTQRSQIEDRLRAATQIVKA